MSLSRGSSHDSGFSTETSVSGETDLTSLSSLSQEGPSAPPQDNLHARSEIELADLGGCSAVATNSSSAESTSDANEDNTRSLSGSLPANSIACEDTSFSARSLALFGLSGEKWRRCLVLHVVISFLLNGLSLSLAIYSSFWGDSAVQKLLSKMQKALGNEIQDAGQCSNSTQDQLLALAKWNSFNNWIISCAEYAKQNVTSGRCKGALESFDILPPHLPTDVAEKLSKRNLEDLAANLRNATRLTAPEFEPLQLKLQSHHYVKLVASLWISMVLLLCTFFFYRRILGVFSYRWRLLSKEEQPMSSAQNEKNASLEQAQPIVTKSLVDNDPNVSLRKRKLESSRQAQKRDIWTAASQGNLGVVEGFYLQNAAPDIDFIHSIHGSLLHAAALSGKAEMVSYFLKKKANPNVVGGRFHSPLQAAAYSGNLKSVQILLESRAAVDAYGGVCGSPLHAAAEKGSIEMVEYLLDAKANPNINGGTYSFPLHAASYRGHEKMVHVLLIHGADINSSGESYSSALHAAIWGGQRAVVETLLQHNANVNMHTALHGSPLQVACREGHCGLAQLLVSQGANIHVTGQDKQTPLHLAARSGHLNLAKALIARGSDINAQDVDGWTPLHHSSSIGHDHIVQLLLQNGARVNVEDKFRAHPLFRSAGQHHSKITASLLAAGSPPDARDCFGRTALHGPAADDDVTVQRLLIEYQADVNAVGDDKKTPLHEAANVGNLANVMLLLEQPGIKTSLQDNDQKTPLHRALDHVRELKDGETEISEYVRIALALLDAPDLDINARSGSALQEAIAHNIPELVAKMLERSASVHLSGGKHGGTAQAAVRSGSTELLALMLSRGAIVNAHGGKYGTALQAAAFLGNVGMLDLLLEHGANVNAAGGKYGSPLNAAKMSRAPRTARDEVVQILLDHHAEVLPVKAHEKDEWALTAGGWTWITSDPWSDVQGIADQG